MKTQEELKTRGQGFHTQGKNTDVALRHGWQDLMVVNLATCEMMTDFFCCLHKIQEIIKTRVYTQLILNKLSKSSELSRRDSWTILLPIKKFYKAGLLPYPKEMEEKPIYTLQFLCNTSLILLIFLLLDIYGATRKWMSTAQKI